MKVQKINIILALLCVLCCIVPLVGGAALTSSIQTTVNSKHTSASGLSTAIDNVALSVNTSFSNGSGTTQVAVLIYHTTGTLAAEGTATYDIAGGVADKFGATVTIVRLKSIVFQNTSGSMTVTLGAAANPVAFFDPATATVTIPPYGVWTWTAPLGGLVIGAGSSDEIKLTNSAGDSCGYKLWIVGGGF